MIEGSPDTSTVEHTEMKSFLLKRWKEMQSARNRSHQYVWNNQQFDSINPKTTDYVLGMYEN